jgi:hypothetical protein
MGILFSNSPLKKVENCSITFTFIFPFLSVSLGLEAQCGQPSLLLESEFQNLPSEAFADNACIHSSLQPQQQQLILCDNYNDLNDKHKDTHLLTSTHTCFNVRSITNS